MTTLNIQLSEELKARIQAKAADSGFEHLEEYIQAVLEADAAEQIVEDEDLEKLLLQRLNDGGEIELTPSFLNQFKEQMQRRRSGKASA